MSGTTDDRTNVSAANASYVVRLDGATDAIDVVADRLEHGDGGVEVLEASGVESALRLIEVETADCVLTDRERGGVRLVEAVRREHDALPCVVFAGDAPGDAIDDALAAGATDVVAGDAETRYELVARRIQSFVEGHRARRSTGEVDSELRAQANLLQQIFEQIPAALYVKDREGRHVRMSDYDVSPDVVLGKTDPEIYGETEFARKAYQDDLRVVETGESILNQEEFNPGNGEWTLTSKVPWYGEDGEIQGLIGVSRIITEKKEYERKLERTNERLERFTGIVSHDLRAPLNVAKGHLEILSERTDSGHVDEVQTSLERMEALIDDLLTLAQQGDEVEDVSEVRLRDVAEDAWDSVRAGAATLEIETDRALYADRQRLRQCFENLFRNALDHAGDDVRVCVGSDGDGFYVADDGDGIPPDECELVLEEGYTTADDGTGFGLSIVEEIASAHGWAVEVGESELGGARFEFSSVEQGD